MSSNFSFFGLEVSNKKAAVFTPNADSVLHLTNVSLDPEAKSGARATLKITTADVKNAVICTLVADKLSQSSIDLLFPGGVEVELTVEGACPVHVVGWSQPMDDEPEEFAEYSDEDEDEEVDSEEYVEDENNFVLHTCPFPYARLTFIEVQTMILFIELILNFFIMSGRPPIWLSWKPLPRLVR